MKITYIFRTPSKEQSIERVFAPIIKQFKASGNEVQYSFAWSSRFWPLAMVANIIRYAIKSYTGGIYHITGDVQYVACLMNPKSTVLTIHDCVMLRSNEIHGWRKKMVYKFWYEIPLKRLKYVTCISETTRQDLGSYFPWATEKLVVVSNPVGEEFVYTPKKFNYTCPRILHIGTRGNKNLERVIEALDGVHCKLDIIGKLSEEQERLLAQHHIDYQNRYYISNQEILKAYQYADIISFPSLFEGFGMPIIEGQTVGRSILSSNREPMRSIAGKGACLVDPESVELIRSGFVKLIEDASYRNKLNAAGIENAKKYNIKETTAQYQALYNKMNK